MTGYTAEGKPAHLMVPRQESPAGKWDASVPVTYSGKPRKGQEDEGNPLGQVTITEPGDSRRTFTHYPEHPDDPDHRELTWGYTGSGPLATGALILNDALGFGTPGTLDRCRGNAGRSPYADAPGIHRGHRGEVPQPAGPGKLATQPQCRAGMGQQVAGGERCERGSEHVIRGNGILSLITRIVSCGNARPGGGDSYALPLIEVQRLPAGSAAPVDVRSPQHGCPKSCAPGCRHHSRACARRQQAALSQPHAEK